MYYKEKWQKIEKKKIGLAYDSGLKLICDAPGKKISHTSML